MFVNVPPAWPCPGARWSAWAGGCRTMRHGFPDTALGLKFGRVSRNPWFCRACGHLFLFEIHHTTNANLWKSFRLPMNKAQDRFFELFLKGPVIFVSNPSHH